MKQVSELSKAQLLWTLFWEFFKIATFVVGGGLAILVAAEDLFVRKYKWLSEDEIPNVMALVQTVPGLIAGNVAIYIGYRMAGLAGSFFALLGVAMPSFLIITAIAMGFAFIPVDHPIVEGAFLGVRTAITAVSVVALMKVWERSLKDVAQYFILAFGVISILLFHLKPGWVVLAGILFGPIYCLLICHKMPEATEEARQ